VLPTSPVPSTPIFVFSAVTAIRLQRARVKCFREQRSNILAVSSRRPLLPWLKILEQRGMEALGHSYSSFSLLIAHNMTCLLLQLLVRTCNGLV
jgi:hypothetical protein